MATFGADHKAESIGNLSAGGMDDILPRGFWSILPWEHTSTSPWSGGACYKPWPEGWITLRSPLDSGQGCLAATSFWTRNPENFLGTKPALSGLCGTVHHPGQKCTGFLKKFLGSKGRPHPYKAWPCTRAVTVFPYDRYSLAVRSCCVYDSALVTNGGGILFVSIWRWYKYHWMEAVVHTKKNVVRSLRL